MRKGDWRKNIYQTFGFQFSGNLNWIVCSLLSYVANFALKCSQLDNLFSGELKLPCPFLITPDLKISQFLPFFSFSFFVPSADTDYEIAFAFWGSAPRPKRQRRFPWERKVTESKIFRQPLFDGVSRVPSPLERGGKSRPHRGGEGRRRRRARAGQGQICQRVYRFAQFMNLENQIFVDVLIIGTFSNFH